MCYAFLENVESVRLMKRVFFYKKKAINEESK